MARLGTVMRQVLELCRVAGTLLTPICPEKGPELLAKLGGTLSPLSGDGLAVLARLDQLLEGTALSAGDPLFPRITELPAIVRASLPAEPVAPPKKKKRNKKKADPGPKAPITFDDFGKLDLRTGVVVEAAPHPNADRLLVLQIDIGEARPRSIVAGIASAFTPAELVGRTVIVVANLVPAELRGVLSEGMLLAAGGEQIVDLATIAAQVTPGTVVR
jgi:methionyl-tRNA synthetase